MSVFSSVSFDDHEQVVFCRDARAGLSAIIAIHDRTLGPAVGGCRMWPYHSDNDALYDVLRLSRGMTYKSAVAGLALGGGKSVIIGDPATHKTEALFFAMGEFIESLGGRYWGAEDVGMNVQNLESIAVKTHYVAGLSKGNAASGDPSPFTALGVYEGICAAVKHRLKRTSLEGLKVAVQGVGNVGYHLCEHLANAGVSLIVSDINRQNLNRVVEMFDAAVVDPAVIHAQAADVFSPCALGGVLNKTTIPQIKATIIAGGANNQLSEDRDGERLVKAGIVYAPDYVINAGGIINVESEVLGSYDRNNILNKVHRIHDTLLEIFERASRDGRSTNVISDEMARDILHAKKQSVN